MMVACRLTKGFREQVQAYGGELTQIGPGVHEVRGLMHLLYCIETEEVSNPVLHIFSRSFLRNPASLLPLLNEAEYAILMEVFDEIQQFKLDARANQRYVDYKEVAMTREEFVEAMMAFVPLEKRLKGLDLETRLHGLSPEDRLKGLSPEEREHLLNLLLANKSS